MASSNLVKGTPFLGILQVKTEFHRPVGDVGNYDTWSIPVKIKIVETRTQVDIVKSSKNFEDDFISDWVDAAQELIDEGAVALITSCGFLATIHQDLQSKFDVPVGTSSLLQIPFARSVIQPQKRIGVLTFDAAHLGKEHLRAVGVNEDVPIVGVDDGCDFQKILRKGEPYNYDAIESDVLKAAKTLVSQYTDIGGILLECTNMPPFKNAVHRATGLPVWDIITLGNYLFEVANPKKFE